MTDPQAWKGPASTGPQNHTRLSRQGNHSTLAAPIDLFLPLLDNVRRYKDGWRADCPVGHRSRGALEITIDETGRVRLRCYACGDDAPILAALGLKVADLFPRRLNPATPQERDELRQRIRESERNAALAVLAREADVIAIAAAYPSRGWILTDEDLERLSLAIRRTVMAREVLQ